MLEAQGNKLLILLGQVGGTAWGLSTQVLESDRLGSNLGSDTYV